MSDIILKTTPSKSFKIVPHDPQIHSLALEG